MSQASPENDFDVAVIGGSYAGQSAALQLARARRRVLVLDAGRRRNRFADKSHGFLGRDGSGAAAIAAEGREQLMAYSTVRWLDATVSRAAKAEGKEQGGFVIATEAGGRFSARRIILATGVQDELPAIDGLAERWGRSIFHCPYCHGYELDQGRIGVLATGTLALHHAMMLPDWGKVTLLTNDAFDPDPIQREALAARGVVIEPRRVARIVEAATVELVDGTRLPFAGLFTQARTKMASPVAEQLGCDFQESPLGSFIRIEGVQATSVQGVFACGDAARMGGNVAIAVADGALAGVAAHRSLMFEGFEHLQ